MHDFNFFGGGMMIFWWVLAIVLVIVIVRALMVNSTPSAPQESPMDILKRRYASGEIDKEEFEQRKKELLK